MKKFVKILVSLLCAAFMAVPVFFAACNSNDSGEGGNKNPSGSTNTPGEWVDYVSQLKLDFTTNTKKQEVTVRTFVDGDTTHFDPVTNSTLTGYDAEIFAKNDGYIKARYLAINTPESTGKIEEWGKLASRFTRSKLEAADAKLGGTIVIESDTSTWDADSTGSRYTLWIWYRLPGESDFRNLNLEILQEGLAVGSSTANNRYGEYGMAALAQAKAYKLYVFSDEKDPDFFYGDAIPLTLRELRCHIEDYNGARVSVTGIVATEFDQSVYIQEYDNETGLYFGISVYYGYPKDQIKEVLCNVGYEVNVVGKVQYYETGDSWQISDVQYNPFRDDPLNSTIVNETPQPVQFTEITVSQFNSKVDISFVIETENEETGEVESKTEIITLPFAEAAMSTTVSVKNLLVTNAYMTTTQTSYGEWTLTCKDADGNTIKIRTNAFKDDDGNTITDQNYYLNKHISISGVIAKFNGYQIRVYAKRYLEILD